MPDWKKAMKDPNLRKLWWDGMSLFYFHRLSRGRANNNPSQGSQRNFEVQYGSTLLVTDLH